MIFWIVEGGHLVEYVRVGECTGCGDCCRKTIRFQWDIQTQDESESESGEDLDWSKWEGWSVICALGCHWYFKVTEVSEEDPLCKYFEGGSCKIHDDLFNRPRLCWFWPVHPENLEHFPNCGYKFERRNKEERDE